MKSTIDYSFKSGLSIFWYNSKLFILDLSDIRVCRGLHVFADDLTFLYTGHSLVELTKNDDDDNFPSSFRVIFEELPESNFVVFSQGPFLNNGNEKQELFWHACSLKMLNFQNSVGRSTRRPATTSVLCALPFLWRRLLRTWKLFFLGKTLSSTYFLIFPFFETF